MNEKEQTAIEAMLQAAASVVGSVSRGNEVEVAQAVAKRVCNGHVGDNYIPNASREQRKRIIAIAFNIVPSDPTLCRALKRADSKKCEKCKKVCCYNKILQRRFAAEMFLNFVIY